jgi:hypothetical protein
MALGKFGKTRQMALCLLFPYKYNTGKKVSTTNNYNALESDAQRLYELNSLVVKAVVMSDGEELAKVLSEYVTTKKRIKTHFMRSPAPQINDSRALSVLQKISEDKNFPADNIIAATEDLAGDSEPFLSLSDVEIEEFGSDMFYSWFSHHEYIRGLYEIGSLVIRLSVPDHIRQFVSEAKECYAFTQYNAVYSLCRTILEASVRHVGDKKNLLLDRNGKAIPIEMKIGWQEMKGKVVPDSMKTSVDSIYGKISVLVHGRKTITSKDARVAFCETLRLVHMLYNHHEIVI